MNERIRELMIRAISDVDSIDDPETRRMYIPNCFAEKFAELIVKECASVAYKTAWDDLTLDYGTGAIPLHIHNTIKEHFGVEE